MTLNTLSIGDWEIWQVSQRLSRRTITERLRVIRLMHAETGMQPIHATATDIVHWTAGHEDDWSDATACTYTSYLRAWFRWLQLVDRRDDNPMVKIGTPRMPDREPRPVSDPDVVTLLRTRMRTRTRIMILLALLAGLRVHEIAKIRGEDFDLGAQLLWVKGKGRRLKSIPLHPILIEIASEMPAAGWWFPMHAYPSEHVLDKSVSDVIGRTMRRAGVRGTPHALRHWYATTLLAGGADLMVVKELMRHQSVATTQVYTKVPDESRREAINRLDPLRGCRSVAA